MAKLLEYTLVHSVDRVALLQDVLEYIKDGWVPLGGVSTCQESQGTAFTQALVLYDDPSEGD